MSAKSPVDGQCPNEISITPRRLRSGTHYGDQNTPTKPVTKNENKKTSRECYQNCDVVNLCKGDKAKASKHDPILLVPDKQIKRQTAHKPTQPATLSPEQKQKSHTLKSILESIEPNLSLNVKNKASKRKSLRDLLDQKFPRDKADKEDKGCAKEQIKPSSNSERRPLLHNGENHHHSKHYSKDVVGTDGCDQRPPDSETKKQTTMHTRTSSQTKSMDTVKEVSTDARWSTTKNRLERNTAKTSSSVELRIKTGGGRRDLEEQNQTFRISCASNSPTPLTRSMKPDIVLKVRPRSASLSALSTSALNACPGNPDPRSKTGPSITPVSLNNSSHHRPTRSTESQAVESHSQGKSRCSSATNRHIHGVVLQEDCPDPQPPPSSTQPFNLDHLNHEDVVEESKLPPVASTVELLSEPHDVHLNHCSMTVHVSSQPQIRVSHQDLIPDQGSPGPRTSEPSPFNASTAREYDKRHAQRTVDVADYKVGRQYGARYPRASRSSTAATFLAESRKEGVEDDEEEWALSCDAHPAEQGVSQADQTLDVKDTMEEGGRSARRRRKGRPCRRLDSQHCWNPSTPHVYPSSPGGQEEGEEEEEEREEEEEEKEKEEEEEEEEGSQKEEWRQQRSGKGLGNNDGGRGGDEEEEKKKTSTTTTTTTSPTETGSLVNSAITRGRSAALERGCEWPGSAATTRRGGVRPQGERGAGATGAGRRKSRKGIDLETLWANPELDTHGFLLWASENRSSLEKRIPDASGVEVEEQLASQWRLLPFSGKLHFLCRARDASNDHNKHTSRRKKASMVQKKKDAANAGNTADSTATTTSSSSSSSEGCSVYEEFVRLPQERQKDLLRKWLRFFQKMLPRLDYQDFIGDFKKACKSLSLRPVPARRRNARLRNLDPSHYHMLFEKIRENRARVMSVYNKRKAREEELLRRTFCAMLQRLITGQPWPFVRGCRSKVLGELLKDIQQLEVEEVLAQIDLPLSLTSSTDLPDHHHHHPGFMEGGRELLRGDPGPLGLMCSPADTVGKSDSASPSDSHPRHPHPQPGPPNYSPAIKEGVAHSRRAVSGTSSVSPSLMSTSALVVTSSGDSGELPDSPLVLKVLDSLRLVAELPVLDQRCLDSIFLAPPSRGGSSSSSSSSSRGQTCRDTQFQNSAAYRRTLLYKHIQPLLDSRGMPLPSSALYHTHSAQYFYSEDR